MDQSEDVRESERERRETLHDVVATTHACDRFVVRNPSTWHSGHSDTRRCQSRADRPAFALARPTVLGSGWSAKRAESTEKPRCARFQATPTGPSAITARRTWYKRLMSVGTCRRDGIGSP